MKYLIRNDDRAMLFNMLIVAGLAVVMLFAIFNVGTYINGTISSSLVDTFPTNKVTGLVWDNRTPWQNRTANTLENVSIGYDDVIDIMVVATIIMAITLPLAAVVAVKKLF